MCNRTDIEEFSAMEIAGYEKCVQEDYKPKTDISAEK